MLLGARDVIDKNCDYVCAESAFSPQFALTSSPVMVKMTLLVIPCLGTSSSVSRAAAVMALLSPGVPLIAGSWRQESVTEQPQHRHSTVDRGLLKSGVGHTIGSQAVNHTQ